MNVSDNNAVVGLVSTQSDHAKLVKVDGQRSGLVVSEYALQNSSPVGVNVEEGLESNFGAASGIPISSHKISTYLLSIAIDTAFMILFPWGYIPNSYSCFCFDIVIAVMVFWTFF